MDEGPYTYYGTKVVRCIKGTKGASKSMVVHFDRWWNFEKGDRVAMRIRRLDGKGKEVSITKRVTETGNSKAIFLDRILGFKEGDVVVFSMTKLDTLKEGDEDDPAAGSKIEESDQGLLGR